MEKEKLKTCRQCMITKFQKEFYRTSERVLSICKECRRNYQREYYENNKDKIINYCKCYYHENKLKVQDRSYKWKEKNLSRVRKYRKDYYHNNKKNKNIELERLCMTN